MKDYIGLKFGRLTVVEESGPIVRTDGGKRRAMKCICDCGNITIVVADSLSSGRSKSCGCLQREAISKLFTKHGLKGAPEYKIWKDIRKRCNNPNDKYYHRYGGRGITICKEWDNFETFLKDMGPRPKSDERMTIDRIDNDKGYSPDNCRWVTNKANCRNTSRNRLIEFRGEIHCLNEWAEIFGIRRERIKARLDRDGWSIERALTTPVGRKYGTSTK